MKQIIPIKLNWGELDIPYWYRSVQGRSVHYIGFENANSPAKTLILGCDGVQIKIHSDNLEECKQSGWLVDYTIQHSLQSLNSGTHWFSSQDLQTAFGLSGVCDAENGQEIVSQHGADVASEGQYIRYREMLNIPGPGHGRDRDPNVSILITQTIKEAITELMRKPE